MRWHPAHSVGVSVTRGVMLMLAFATSAGTLLQQREIRQEGISVSIRAGVRTFSYTSSTADALVLIPEAVPIVVGIANVTGETITVGSAQQHWAAVGVERLEDGSTPSLGREPRLDREIQRSAQVTVTLEPGAHASARFLLRSHNGEPLPTGHYRLTVTVDPNIMGAADRRYRNILSHTIVVEVREPQTNEDVMDQYLQRAYRALAAERHEESRQWLDKVLALNPNSVIALNDLGSSFLREGNCRQAVPILERVLSLLQWGADPHVRFSENLRAELIPALRGVLATRCPK